MGNVGSWKSEMANWNETKGDEKKKKSDNKLKPKSDRENNGAI